MVAHLRTSACICGFFLLSGCAKRYRVEGMIIAVSSAERRLTVSHRAIPNFMPAMVMPIEVHKAEELKDLRPGARVEFRLEVSKRGSFARNIRRQNASVEGVPAKADESFSIPVPPEKIAIGARMPDFELIDQRLRRVTLSGFAGKLVAVNFIYTRCPLPEVCPRLSASFASLQRRFRERLGKDFILASITLDPQYDTSEVLSSYAERLRADPDGWRFLTGPAVEIETVARRFGLTYWAEEGVIIHTSATGLIGRDGRLAALVEGSSWRAEQLGDLIAHHLEVK